MRISLSKRIYFLTALPLVVFVGVVAHLNLEGWWRYQAATRLESNAGVFIAASQLIHRLQRERGLSALYLGSKIQQSELAAERAIVDEKARALESALRVSKVPDSVRELWKSYGSNWSQNRKNVDEHKPVIEVTKQFTAAIGQLLKAQVESARAQSLDGIEMSLTSLTLLETAKEAAGRLRAGLSTVLSMDRPLELQDLARITEFKTGVVVSLNSPALFVSPEGKEKLDQFLFSEEWKGVLASFDNVLKYADRGNFGDDPKAFFSRATASIDRLGDLINVESAGSQAKIIEVKAATFRSFWLSLSAALLTVVVIVTLSFRLVRKLSADISDVTEKLDSGSLSLADLTNTIASSSKQLEQSGTEQADALRETATAIEEVSAMVARNADHSEASKKRAKEGAESARSGKGAVQQMNSSIEDLSVTYSQIISQVESGHKTIAEIADSVRLIEERTKVINDIVFQTKLLSFNASVEAARAGEAGKGFSVVAEEIAQLAQMSGSAAKDIFQILSASTQKAQTAMESAREQAEALARVGREKLSVSISSVQHCEEALEGILVHVEDLERVSEEIATASSEQAKGIQEISRAMGQINQASQQERDVATQSSSAAVQLKSEAESLNDAISMLTRIVTGGKDHFHAPVSDALDSRLVTVGEKKKSSREMKKAA